MHGGSALDNQWKEPRFLIGLGLTVMGCVIGFIVFVAVIFGDYMGTPVFGKVLALMGKTAIVAYLPVGLYLLVPFIVDRYDPEPWWALLGVFMWGAWAATGASLLANNTMESMFLSMTGDKGFASYLTAAISAPIWEEATKGLAIVGLFVFLRREFDGVVDGIIYGTFVGIGFAATENIVYYARGAAAGQLTDLFVLRGMITPYLHPLFASMTGIGFGLARERSETWAKFVFPILGYGVAVFMHAWWNGFPTLVGIMTESRDAAMAMSTINKIVGILMALTFFVVVVALVYRKGKTIKNYLKDEVLIGTITQQEFELITSYGNRMRAFFKSGMAGVRFVKAGARLALSKWHTTRAMKGQKRTISMDFIVPLRQELAKQRQQMQAHRR